MIAKIPFCFYIKAIRAFLPYKNGPHKTLYKDFFCISFPGHRKYYLAFAILTIYRNVYDNDFPDQILIIINRRMLMRSPRIARSDRKRMRRGRILPARNPPAYKENRGARIYKTERTISSAERRSRSSW